jgi:hypothetical protein
MSLLSLERLEQNYQLKQQHVTQKTTKKTSSAISWAAVPQRTCDKLSDE